MNKKGADKNAEIVSNCNCHRRIADTFNLIDFYAATVIINKAMTEEIFYFCFSVATIEFAIMEHFLTDYKLRQVYLKG